MLCRLCETFLTNILHQEFHTWKRIEQGWSTFKLGDYLTIAAAAKAGCEVCALCNRVRCEKIVDYSKLAEKWHTQPASIDVKYDEGSSKTLVDYTDRLDHLTPKWSFHLMTVAPQMSWIPFELFHPHGLPSGDDTLNDELGVGWPKAVSFSPTSGQTLDVARKWIHQCCNDHYTCRRSSSVTLPTRVIDVGTSEQYPIVRLKADPGLQAQYVTLSHCWGVGKRLVLVKDNLDDFKSAIPSNALSRTFRDAILLTISLGVRYLWIDALCIIQDDIEDWRKESASMCSIFENAYFSISALSAPDTHSGMLAEREIAQTVSTISGASVGVRTRLHSLSEALQHSRLETRAWCYQERLLAQAILHVGPHQLYWECRSMTAAEAQIDSEGQSEDMTASVGSSSMPPGNDDSVSWLRLVTQYSGRQITKPSDRLPAIAGLASMYRESHSEKVYMQGLWAGDENAALLWRRQRVRYAKIIPSRDTYHARTATRITARPQPSIASTWSWASINDAVEYPVSQMYRIRLGTKCDAVFPTSNTEQPDHSHAILAIRGAVIRGSCKPSRDLRDGLNQATFRSSGSAMNVNGVSCFLDYDDDPESKGCYCLRIANWTSTESRAIRKRQDSAIVACYLILEKIGDYRSSPSEDTPVKFKRIGMGYDLVAKVDKLFSNAPWRQLHLL